MSEAARAISFFIRFKSNNYRTSVVQTRMRRNPKTIVLSFVFAYHRSLPFARRKFRAPVDPPDPNVSVEDRHFAASQSPSATGVSGWSYFNTDPLSGCVVTGVAEEMKTCTASPSENGTWSK